MDQEQVDKRLTQLARKMGERNASALLSVLGKDKQFINALETSLGQELLKDAVNSIENKMSLILSEKDEPQDRAELQAYLSITRKWQKIINRYNKNRNEFDKNIV